MDKETRGRAKAVNFGIVYGISPFGLAANLGIDQKTAKTYIETYFDRYSGVRTFIETTLAETRESGHVTTLFGRTRPIPDIHSRNPNARGFAERTAVNTPLQGTAADMIKVAMLAIDKRPHRPATPHRHDPPGPRRTPLRHPTRRSRRSHRPRQNRNGEGHHPLHPHRRRSKPRPQLARRQVVPIKIVYVPEPLPESLLANQLRSQNCQ